MASKKRRTKDDVDKDIEVNREKHRKHIAEISENINTSFYDTTPEEANEESRQWFERQLAKYGCKVSVRSNVTEKEPVPVQQKMESMEEWHKLLDEKRNLLRKAVKNNLPQI